jgi:uncharacterized protein (TIGR02145 family)
MDGKYVYNSDLSSTYQWKTTATACTGPQCATGLDPNYPANYSLVSPQTNPDVDFINYPAQNACKAVGGRVPNMQELSAVYAGRASYGNNFQADFYWSSTEYDDIKALQVAGVFGAAWNPKDTGEYFVRCIRDIPTVTIGTQTWMQYNLNVGTRIDGATTQSNNSVIEKYCYDNNFVNCTTYGGLYQWNEMMQYVTTAGVQGICPIGFHLPTDVELTTLETYLGPDTAGTQLQPGGTSGFNIQWGGGYEFGEWGYIKEFATLWSSTQNSTQTTRAWLRSIWPGDQSLYTFHANKVSNALSVRCLKN